MSEKMRIKVIAGFLIGAVIWAGLNYESKDTTPKADEPLTVQPLEPGQLVKKRNSTFIDISSFDSLSWGRSPFYLARLSVLRKTQAVVKNTETLSWILSGIIFNNSSPTAIINKRPVKIGEKIDNAIVTQIEKNKVTIKYKQKKITLRVSKG